VTTTHAWGDAPSPYVALGGETGVRSLAWAFYDVVEATSPLIEEMLPVDRSESRQKLFEFLSGWTGGPPLYWERRGHPALRLRHSSFPIDRVAADEWVRCLAEAAAHTGVAPDVARFLVTELGRAAHQLENRPHPSPRPPIRRS